MNNRAQIGAALRFTHYVLRFDRGICAGGSEREDVFNMTCPGMWRRDKGLGCGRTMHPRAVAVAVAMAVAVAAIARE
ncbi:MAG: hypothetical protein D6814_07265 [Calditrichaeota bacterium]|nr:MAG: hypothetical protein D6814_07265 [Calditrichota bacterium]